MCLSSAPCSRQRVSLNILPVKVKGPNGKSVDTYAFIDPGSDKTFADERLISRLGIQGKKVSYAITSVHKSEGFQGREVDLGVCALDGSNLLQMKKVWTLKKIPISLDSLPSTDQVAKYDHLSDISVPKLKSKDVMLLIGSDVPDISVPLEVRRGKQGEPCAIRSPLGWSIVGPFCQSTSAPARVNYQKTDILQTGLGQTRQPESTWPKRHEGSAIDDDDPEIKRESHVNAVAVTDPTERLICHYSSFMKLMRAAAWMRRFFVYLKTKETQEKEITVEDVTSAEMAVISYVQHKYLPDECKRLQRGESVKKQSPLHKLAPVLSKNVVSVGGRMRNASIECTAQHPIVIPPCHLSKLLIQQAHSQEGHAGKTHVLNKLREKYWLIKGQSQIKREIGNCFQCKRYTSRPCSQQMADLPRERVTADMPPFSYTGVDFFGPMTVKVRRSTEKRYGCLFTCMASRAVHIEVASKLDTDSFLGAVERFISRRGKPDKMFSDRGTNFVAGERELRESLNQWNKQQVGQEMTQRHISWEFNPPYASHMGGVWERMIGSVKKILRFLTQEQSLKEETLHTFLCVTERIINDRPITKVSSDPTDPLALTPNMLLLARGSAPLPPGLFTRDDHYARRWWRQVNYLADQFWKRWIKEYLPILQRRDKWQRPRRNLRVGDVVLVIDENQPRGSWPMGLITTTHAGKDGYVRSCDITTNKGRGSVTRPITRLCLLEESNDTCDIE